MPPICSVHSWFLGQVILHYFEKDNLLIAVVVYMAFYLPLFHEVMKIISPRVECILLDRHVYYHLNLLRYERNSSSNSDGTARKPSSA